MPPHTDRRPLRGPEPLESRDLPTVSFVELPLVPDLDPATLANVRQIAFAGRQRGLRADAFLKVGDSNTATPDFLVPLGRPDYDPNRLGLAVLPAEVQATVAAF